MHEVTLHIKIGKHSKTCRNTDNYTVSKNGSTKLTAVTLSNLNGFSKFFHRWILREFVVK